jgi:hypothetical protein
LFFQQEPGSSVVAKQHMNKKQLHSKGYSSIFIMGAQASLPSRLF